MRHLIRLIAGAVVLALFVPRAQAQTRDAESKAVIAVADALLAALSTGDNMALARLTMDSAVVGGAGLRGGVESASLRPWAVYINRTGPSTFTERGFGATARVQDRVAQVWMPYDLYIGDKWSHCGVDTFTLMKREGQWRVASLVYTNVGCNSIAIDHRVQRFAAFTKPPHIGFTRWSRARIDALLERSDVRLESIPECERSRRVFLDAYYVDVSALFAEFVLETQRAAVEASVNTK